MKEKELSRDKGQTPALSKGEFDELFRCHILGSLFQIDELNRVFQTDTAKCLVECKNRNEEFLGGNGDLEHLQFWYRALLRSFFAQVEGTCYLMRRAVLCAYDRGELRLEPEVADQLAEEKDGRTRFNPVLLNIELAFKWLPRVVGQTYAVHKGGRGWSSFCDLHEYRNQIAHPKGLDSFMLPASDFLPNVEPGMLWLVQGLEAVLVLTRRTATEKVDRRLTKKQRRNFLQLAEQVRTLQEQAPDSPAFDLLRKRVAAGFVKLFKELTALPLP